MVIFFALAFGLTIFMPAVARYLLESRGFPLGQVLGIILSLGRAIFSAATRSDMRVDFCNFVRSDLTSTGAWRIELLLAQELGMRIDPVKSRLGKRRQAWDSFPSQFIEKLKMEIGDVRFNQLTQIAEKHGLFTQKVFQDPKGAYFFDDTPYPGGGSESTMGTYFFTTALGTMANALAKTDREECIRDALVLLDTALCIMPENPTLRISMALLCSYFSELQDEAKTHARLALQYMDGSPIKASELVDSQMREQMSDIIQGTYVKK
jgi:hypothetical protein